MKFVMIIMFATMGDVYMFTEPSFDSKNECMNYLMQNGPMIHTKLLQEYGYPREIQAVNCLREQEFMSIISGQTAT